MPTIKQLPAATAVAGSDLIPLSQNGLTRGVAVSTLLSNTQPQLSLAQGTLLGRGSIGLGGPEALTIGTGLALQSGAIVASGIDHTSFTASVALLADDEVIVNSSATPKRLPAVKLRSLFSAGSGVQIDSNGVISTISSPGAGSGSAGAAGPKGDTGAQGPAGQGFTFRGPWQPNVGYAAYDVVTNGGQTYVAALGIAAATSFSQTSWTLVAAQGAIGPGGASGPIGPAGPTIAATSMALGGIKSGTGLSVAADGTLSISNVTLGSLAQGSATVGQLLGWSGVGWSPTTPAAGVSYTGAAPVTVASGVIGLGQSSATVGQVLTWTGSAWQPQNTSPTGAMVGTATPLANGTAGPGIATTASREDHRHPTDASRAPLAGPIFTTSITLPTWTTTTRPSAPTVGMEGYATDTSRRETYTPTGWVQYVRTADMTAASGQLFGGSGVAGAPIPISIGAGLSLASGVLAATATTPPPSAALSGVSIDGVSITASAASPYQMMNTDRVVDVNKSSAAATKILLPQNPTLWVDYTVIDGRGDATNNNITLALASGATINGQSSFTMNANNDAITLRAINATTWRVA